jgi:hypothetical protein
MPTSNAIAAAAAAYSASTSQNLHARNTQAGLGGGVDAPTEWVWRAVLPPHSDG